MEQKQGKKRHFCSLSLPFSFHWRHLTLENILIVNEKKKKRFKNLLFFLAQKNEGQFLTLTFFLRTEELKIVIHYRFDADGWQRDEWRVQMTNRRNVKF